ncbi:hypothetical protein EMIT0P258_230002 [Pseudomonas sp. IT-P258]
MCICAFIFYFYVNFLLDSIPVSEPLLVW